ncbi:spore cortex biosynthesis protein YabQ [Bacillaceae bacterium IKA-2]|nr:spore cortex biosynthesis protein YabQ [Bacillaceae bacterium IKA-2]
MSLTVQLQTMLVMVAMGGWLGIAIDTYSRLIRGRKWNKFITVINDSLFWILQGLFIFFILLQINEGEMRFYILLALLCGYSIYQAFLYKIYQLVLETTIRIIVKIFRFLKTAVIVILINPTKELLKLLYTVCMMIIRTLKIVIFFLLKLLYSPFLWVGRGVWRILPNEKFIKFKNKQGFLKKMKNYIKRLKK